MRIEPSEGHLWGGVYLDITFDKVHVDTIIGQAMMLYPQVGILFLRMEPMIVVSHLSSKDQEQECAEFIVRELERLAA